ncbi:FtsX-like permease family protein [Candidatus Beckwithbacteria bacterium]|nr:FtsX-like permease family protein [Candidatus Beckwithbacteria bacterium]
MIVFLEIFETAFISLLRNKLRSILTMLGIIIGVASVILLISIGSGLQSYVTNQFENLGSNLIYVMPGDMESGYTLQSLKKRDVTLIKRIGFPVKDVSPSISAVTTVKYKGIEKKYEVSAFDEAGIKMMNFKPAEGRLLNNEDVSKNARVALIGPKVEEALFGKLSAVGKSIMIQSSEYKVVGVFESKGGGSGGIGRSVDEQVMIPITTAQKQFNQDTYNAISVQITSKDEIENAKKKIEKAMLKIHKKDEFSIMGMEDLLKTINSILSVITAGLGGIAAISLLVGGIGIMNIMYVTVTERTKEIGLRKALGARPSDILIQFLIESVVVSVIGGSIGIIFAMLGSMIISQFFTSEVTLSSILLAFGFSSFIGVIFGVFPAYKAAKLDPITALRYE